MVGGCFGDLFLRGFAGRRKWSERKMFLKNDQVLQKSAMNSFAYVKFIVVNTCLAVRINSINTTVKSTQIYYSLVAQGIFSCVLFQPGLLPANTLKNFLESRFGSYGNHPPPKHDTPPSECSCCKSFKILNNWNCGTLSKPTSIMHHKNYRSYNVFTVNFKPENFENTTLNTK